MGDSFLYKLTSGKPVKLFFFLKGYAKMGIPPLYFRLKARKLMRQVENRPDRDYILDRAGYYNRLPAPAPLPSGDIRRHEQRYFYFVGCIRAFRPSTFHKAYYFDLRDVMRYFNPRLRIGYVPGDVYFTPPFPALVKSRLLSPNNQNSVVLKLDKLRHFLFVDDSLRFDQKKDKAIFRGKIRHSRVREAFMERYYGSRLCDCGVVGKNEGNYPPEWMAPKKTIREHLAYKFVMALEGNDVASNLKWVMSSNSVAVMTRPTCETWFMEGRLKPGYHYIEIKDDLSDLEEKLAYYIRHTSEAQAIINHAHEFVAQFFDRKRERLISLLVADKYFRMTGQGSVRSAFP